MPLCCAGILYPISNKLDDLSTPFTATDQSISCVKLVKQASGFSVDVQLRLILSRKFNDIPPSFNDESLLNDVVMPSSFLN